MQWQSDLLEYSWKRVNQEGALIRLVATDDPENLPTQKYAHCIAARLWDIHPETGDAYPVYNKPASLLEWLFRDRPEGTVLLLDPDCVFRQPITQRAAPGFPASQRWVKFVIGRPSAENPFGLGTGFSFLNDHCARTDLSTEAVMIPTLIHTSDLRRVCARWLELCGLIRQNFRNAKGLPIWEADMYAYLVACAEYGLQHKPLSLGICTNWQADDAHGAPIIHYSQPVLSEDGQEIFTKHGYAPWTRIDTLVEPEYEYGRDLIAVLNEYIDHINHNVRQPSFNSCPKWRDGVMEGRVVDEILLEAPADGRSVWLNISGKAIWELCDGSRTLDQIRSELERRFSANGRDLKADVLSLVEQLRRHGFLGIQ
jgi:Coenzyme PQQ synthesis protein D (PqqD)